MRICTHVYVVFIFPQEVIASSFTETHYLQGGTDISLIRNYSKSCLDRHDTVQSDLCLNSVAVLSPASHMPRSFRQTPGRAWASLTLGHSIAQKNLTLARYVPGQSLEGTVPIAD